MLILPTLKVVKNKQLAYFALSASTMSPFNCICQMPCPRSCRFNKRRNFYPSLMSNQFSINCPYRRYFLCCGLDHFQLLFCSANQYRVRLAITSFRIAWAASIVNYLKLSFPLTLVLFTYYLLLSDLSQTGCETLNMGLYPRTP